MVRQIQGVAKRAGVPLILGIKPLDAEGQPVQKGPT
jgi:hypothetical protein